MNIDKTKSLEIIKTFGVKPQLRKFAEENYELIEAIHEGDILHIKEEIADNLLMLNEFITFFHIDENELYDIVTYKQKRTIEYMQGIGLDKWKR